MNSYFRFGRVLYQVFVIVVLILLYISLVRFGLYYTYDFDEMYHSQLVFLLAHGAVPYHSFFTTYTVLFHWLLIPLGNAIGYSWNTVFAFRVGMGLLFVIRLGCAFYLVKNIFGLRSAVFFLWLSLVEPFTLFTSHQIRPDNLSLTFYSIGLLLLYISYTRKLLILSLLAGFFWGTALVTHGKIFPSISIFLLLFLMQLAFKKNVKKIGVYFIGFILSPILYVVCLVNYTDISTVVQQILYDPYRMQQSLGSRVHPSFFFTPDNSFIYGFLGKPPQWYFAQIYPIFAIVGIGVLMVYLIQYRNVNVHKKVFLYALTLATILQVLLLFIVPTTYIQYFGPAYFNSMILVSGLLWICVSRWENTVVSPVVYVGVSSILLILSIYTVKSHWIRTGYVIDEQMRGYTIKFGMFQSRLQDSYEQTWRQIPPNAAVFPAYLFRPMPYPLGQFFYPEIPREIIGRYQSIITLLDGTKIPYIVMSDYLLQRMPVEFQRYVSQFYQKENVSTDVYKRL